MKTCTLLFGAAWLFLAAILPSLQAEIIGIDTFDYPDGPIANQSGGVFWNYKNTSPTGYNGAPSTWDAVVNAPTVTAGELVTFGNAVAKREYNGFSEIDGAIRDANVAKTVYYRVNVTTGPSVAPGDYFGISSVDGSVEKLYFGKGGDSPNWTVEEVGVSRTTSGITILANQTYTLVVQVDLPGDRIRLYVNPDLNSAQDTSFNENTAQVADRAYTGTAISTAVRFAAGTAVRWDNLVVATTWEELRLTVVTTKDDEDDGALALLSPNDVSLREAVKYSAPGSLITFAAGLNGQTCTLSTGSEIVVTKNLTLDASSLSRGLTIDGGTGTNRLFYVNSGQSLTLRGLTLTGGNGTGAVLINDGGAILNDGALTLTQCTLSGNSASNGGGAISNYGTLTLTQCTLSGNSARNGGGAIVNDEGILMLTRCTLSGNFTSGLGGAILNRGTLTLAQCIVAGNNASGGVGPDVSNRPSSTVSSTGLNLLSSLANSGLTAGPTVIVGDPKLSPLGYFGGPVQTMHPLIGSPAIDAIVTTDPGGTDARGFERFVDGDNNGTAQLDIGAVEVGSGAAFPVNTLADEDDGDIFDIFGAGTSLREAIKYSPPGSIIVFSPALAGQTITLAPALGEISVPATASGLFIDASNLSGPVTISGNNASRVFNIASGATLAMHNLVITGGRAPDGEPRPPGSAGQGKAGENGGGILNAGSLSLFSSTVTNNRSGNGTDDSIGGAGGLGGGIFSSGALNVVNSTLANNRAGDAGLSRFNSGSSGGSGGGIASTGSLSLTTSTLSGNIAGNGGNGGGNGLGGKGGNGGGIFSGGPLSLTACTLSGNNTGSGGRGAGIGAGVSDSGDGGGVSSGNVILRNCLIASNAGYGTAQDVNVASFTTLGANLFSTAANVTATGTPPPTINPNPLLAPLADNGGPTQTMALLPGSPAINAATSSTATSDQRGFPIVGVADIGAFEYQPASLVGVLVASGDLSFGSVTVGSSATRTINLENSGTAVINVSGLSLPAGFSGNFTGDIAFNTIQQVNITFTPTSAVAFTGTLAVNSDAASGTRTLPISGNGFVPPVAKFKIALKASPSSRGKVSGAGSFAKGKRITVKAQAKSGKKFVAWKEGSKIVSKKTSYSFTVTKARSLVATFK